MKTKITILLSGLLLATCMVKAQQGPPPGQKPPSPEEHSKQVSSKLEKDLTLNPAQKAKVEAAYKNFFTGIEKVRGKMPPPPPPPLPPGKKKSADSLVAIRDAEIKKVLTQAQFTKYKEVEKTMRPPRPQGPPPPNAPDKQQ
ncbi:hypothetical protein BEL04_03935 [Mucilaginibacter sp. PPCGB 2223]|uniref:hypothetical protein n=1 Tax=Mucilaginibacter sp. PPCGB 2223 TaxID=1886027 RepID=UPI00082686CC|nr:hypothetical protein [Mucilaginibacter sp. PPCGB 2223]OCX53461.1 hypothetical protein BEL04_03935 [Mucilaginibacter sp. PPCGB 2223]